MNLWAIRNGFGITVLLILLAVFPSTLRGIQPADDLQAVVSIWDKKQDKCIGTGFLISPDGFILTNEHVTRDRAELVARLSDGQKLLAQVVKKVFKPEDQAKDLALLKIDAQNLPWAKLGNSDRLKVGDHVTVIGYPENLGCERLPTVTMGNINALNISQGVYKGLIQIDAQVKPGSSGSPVFSTDSKEVIGVIVGGFLTSPFFFAIPINVAAETDALKLHEVLPSYPPEITFIEFPNKIIGDGQPYKGRVGFRDLNRDLIKARFQVKGSGGKIRDAEETASGDFVLTLPKQVREETSGEFEFDLSVAVPNQEVTVSVTLEDEQKNRSATVSFSFFAADYLLLADFTECRKKEPVSNWGAFSIKGWAKESCKDGVMRIVYNVSENDFPSARPDELVAGFWMQWDARNFKPDEWDAISFSIWGDSKEGFTVKVKVEVKIREASWGWRQYCLEGITDKEQRVTIPLEKFVIADEWNKTNEFVLAFANQDPTMDCPVTAKKGAIYIDQIAFRKKK